jgi:hypothetical protein
MTLQLRSGIEPLKTWYQILILALGHSLIGCIIRGDPDGTGASKNSIVRTWLSGGAKTDERSIRLRI